jgi:uncharacterized protein YcgI (DUF1989 family)
MSGEQVADLILFNLHNLHNKRSPPNTLLLNKQLFPAEGYSFFFDEVTKTMTIVVANPHGKLPRQFHGYGGYVGLRKDIPCPVKRVYELSRRARWFLLDRSKVKAGEYIDFKAEMNVLAIFSNYSQTRKA